MNSCARQLVHCFAINISFVNAEKEIEYRILAIKTQNYF